MMWDTAGQDDSSEDVGVACTGRRRARGGWPYRAEADRNVRPTGAGYMAAGVGASRSSQASTVSVAVLMATIAAWSPPTSGWWARARARRRAITWSRAAPGARPRRT